MQYFIQNYLNLSISIQSLSRKPWMRPNYEKSKLDEHWEMHSIIIKKSIDLFYYLVVKTEKLRHIFICCSPSPIQYYSFFRAGLKISSLFCLFRLTRKTIRLLFFWPGLLENLFLFCRPCPARPIGKIICHLSARALPDLYPTFLIILCLVYFIVERVVVCFCIYYL